MEIKTLTEVNVPIIPNLKFAFCTTPKKYIDTLNYYEHFDDAREFEQNYRVEDPDYLHALVDNNDDEMIVVIHFGRTFVNEMTTRKYNVNVSKAINRTVLAVTSEYTAVYPYVFMMTDGDELNSLISDRISDVIWEYCDSLLRKLKEDKKNAEGKTYKKRGPKPKADKTVVAQGAQPEQTLDEQVEKKNVGLVENGKDQNTSLEPGSNAEPKQRKKPGPKPKAKPAEEAPKKRRGRHRKTAEAFDEEQPKTDLDDEEEAAKEAESIPVEGQPATAEIDFGF